MADEPKLGPVARRLAATRRVLCVEDEPDIAAFLRAYFRAAGYDFVHLDPTDPDEVLRALADDEPDLVLLDVRLRGFSGLEAYRRMRTDERWAFTPVIMVSAHAESTPGFRKPSGLDAFVPKPFNTNVLADLVNDRIERAQELEGRGRDTRQRAADPGVPRGPPRRRDRPGPHRRHRREAVAGHRADRSPSRTSSTRSATRASTTSCARSSNGPGRCSRRRRCSGSTRRDEVAVVAARGRPPHRLQRAPRPRCGRCRASSASPAARSSPVALTAGLASYPTNAADPDGLFMAADAALADAVDDGAAVRRPLATRGRHRARRPSGRSRPRAGCTAVRGVQLQVHRRLASRVQRDGEGVVVPLDGRVGDPAPRASGRGRWRSAGRRRGARRGPGRAAAASATRGASTAAPTCGGSGRPGR